MIAARCSPSVHRQFHGPARPALRTVRAAPRRQRHSMTVQSFFSNIFGARKAVVKELEKLTTRGWQPSPSDGAKQRKYSEAGYDITPLTAEEKQAAADKLTDFQRYVTLDKGTERTWSGETVNGYKHNIKHEGIWVSAIGGLPLFSSKAKFESGTGWPSFYEPIDPAHVIEVPDNSGGMSRVEIIDARSGAHLGHVFDDGPEPTGKRYCMNAAAMRFYPRGQRLPAESQPAKKPEEEQKKEQEHKNEHEQRA